MDKEKKEESSAIHPAVAPLAYLLGTWKGEGEGGYPTINSFRYGEELHFSHPASGKPVIAYSHKTWKLDSGQSMHSESGYWRSKPDGSLEVVIAQSTGLAEVLKGTYSAEDNVIKLYSQVVANASKLQVLKANPDRNAKGTIIEAGLHKSKGSVATFIMQNGTLKRGDVVVCGEAFGKVHALFDDGGNRVDEAGPSIPVQMRKFGPHCRMVNILTCSLISLCGPCSWNLVTHVV